MTPRLHPLRAAAALCLLSTAPALWAANPIRGGTLYEANCVACHGPAEAPTNVRSLNTRNVTAVLQSAIANNRGGMGVFSGSLSAADLADIAAFLGNAPTALSFASTPVGSSSAKQTLTVRTGRVALSNITVSTSSEFTRQGGTCGSTLAANSACTVDVLFQPTQAGQRSGTLSLVHSGIPEGVSVGLSGTATAVAVPTLTLNATSLDFGTQTLNQSSASRSVTASNSGTTALSFSSLAVSGAAAADYTTAGNCSTTVALQPAQSCTVELTFRPSAVGSRAATLQLASNASNGTGSVALSGTGQQAPAPVVSLAPGSLDFGNQVVGTSSANRNITLSNTGNAALSITGIAASGAFGVNHACGSSLPAGGSCTLQVSFTPTGAGAASGAVTVTSDAAGSPQRVSLNGTGTLSSPTLVWSPATTNLAFGEATVGAASAMKTLTLSNQGPGDATLASLALSGNHAADYRVDASSTCAQGLALPANSTCTVKLSFTPSAAGAREAALTVNSNGSNPGTIALGGTGVAAAAPKLMLSATALSFSVPAAGGTAAAQTVTLSNSGNAPLTISAYSSSNAAFSVSAGASNGCTAAPLTLAPAASCTLQVSWASGNAEQASGTLQVSSNAAGSPASVTLNGQRESDSNQGGGGCTLGGGDARFDPMLWGMTLLAGLMLWRRRKPQGAKA
ncbi:choice-of-anchor D domain-containing protein [Ideonella sp.]|jgi:hypothetical protein|uniref:choice-of-anchor D domain-containing protein n=1 Tax=Ideonella sp. TaxID=1929293 RepID=UPI0037BE7CC8